MLDCPVILTGFMGSGKSSVGKRLSELLHCPFVDLDAEIVATERCSINNIFSQRGEVAFRAIESVQLERVLADGGLMVLATGGGVVISEYNRKLMRAKGVVVNLDVSIRQVLLRLEGCTNRPLLMGDSVQERVISLKQSREQFYADADIRIDTNEKSVEDVAHEIISQLRGFQFEYPVCKSWRE